MLSTGDLPPERHKPCDGCGAAMTTGALVKPHQGTATIVIYEHEATCRAAYEFHRQLDRSGLREAQLHRFLYNDTLPRVVRAKGSGLALDSLTSYEAALAASVGAKWHQVALDHASRFVRAVRDEKRIPTTGLGLTGDVGSGKSTLLAAMLRDALRAYFANQMGDLVASPVKWVLEQELWRRLTADMQNEGTSGADLLERCRDAPILVLDNLGGQATGKWWVDTVLFSLLEWRIQSGRPTCFTSKRDLPELQGYWESGRPDSRAMSAEDLVDRLRQHVRLVPIMGPTLRAPDADF